MIVAIIPARGGSKRIPRKNIKEFHGKPMISDEVFVSTDDEEIAAIARKFGAVVPVIRSTKNSDDFATTYDVLAEVLNYYATTDRSVGSACCIYPCTPLLNTDNLADGFNRFNNSAFDVLLSSVKFEANIQRGFTLNEDGNVHLLQPELILERSQDLTPAYHDAGAFYFFDTASLAINKSLWVGHIGALELSADRVQDIDTPEDWRMAELKYELLK
jgi:pseudaminic acid cytidylyltransferase